MRSQGTKAARKPISPQAARKQLIETRTALRDLRHGKSITRVLGQGFDQKAVNSLFKENKLPKMHPKVIEKLKSFLNEFKTSVSESESRRHEKAKVLAKEEGITETRAYRLVLESQRPQIEKMLVEKSALEQLLFVASHQKAKKGNVDSVKPTRAVKEFGQLFRGNADKAQCFVELCEAVSKIPITGANPAIAEAYYGMPTAEETIMAGSILAPAKEGKLAEPAWGCGMQCDIINAVLNSWKWKNYHVRTESREGKPHSVVLAKVPGEGIWLVADPFKGSEFLKGCEKFGGSSVVSEAGLNTRKFIKHMEKKGKWAKGKSLGSHVKNFAEYEEGK